MFDILYEKLTKEIKLVLKNKLNNLNMLKTSFIFKNPDVLVIDKVYLYNDLIKKIKVNMEKIITLKNNNYINLLNKIEVLNPITTIKRGYSIVRINDKAITSIKNIKKGDILTNQLRDGNIKSEVIQIIK